MLKTISAIEARRQFGQIMNEVSLKEDDYIIERAGKPLVAIVPLKKYEWMKQEKERARDKFFKWVDEIRETTKDVDPEILEHEIAEAVEAVKKQEREEINKVNTVI
ncbi:MAG: type II toxin-antitoxin system Phd/YefM family antitoxin [Nitrospirae bacterium]|nr:type II toxin-antitoxin system Phd/YefM family antitoxin [Nitrospirota bacterium]MBF0535381.1 type II toxin-antitoxin system Phd/YefM family antitoxin [Nitrospirota bacterium]MBF0616901.1 type II toxin-antitoxin system Phd/YefM family antitoxin [Nitrospirota bacterium]